MLSTKKLVLDNITYLIHRGPAFFAWKALNKVLSLKPNLASISDLLELISIDGFEEFEAFLWEYVEIDGEYLTPEVFDRHFANRAIIGHILKVLLVAVEHQFAEYFQLNQSRPRFATGNDNEAPESQTDWFIVMPQIKHFATLKELRTDYSIVDCLEWHIAISEMNEAERRASERK